MEIAIGEGKTYQRKDCELLHPAREGQDILNGLKTAMGSQAFSAQYQQLPVPLGGDMIKWKWFQTYDHLPDTGAYRTQIIQSWDTASKSGELNDYSVGITAILEKNCFYIVDIIREKLDYPDLKRTIIANKANWNATSVLIEDKGSGTSLIQDLKREHLHAIAINPDGDKIVRMSACSAQIEAGQVLIPKSAPWLGEFQNEILGFPNSDHDDQVDALSQMLNWNRTRSWYTLENL